MQLSDEIYGLDPITGKMSKQKLASTKSTSVNGTDGSSSSLVSNISGQFDSSYDKATAGYAPFSGDHSKIDQLQSLYGGVGNAFDVSGTVAKLDASRRTNLLTGEAAANDAASKFAETQNPGVQSGTASSLIRARALLPFLNADTEAAGETGKYVDTAKQNALKTGADIASKLAELEQNYTNSLANYNSDKANFGLNFAKGQTDATLTASSATNNSLALGLQAQRQANDISQRNQDRADTERQRQLAMNLSGQRKTAETNPGFYFTNNVGQRVNSL